MPVLPSSPRPVLLGPAACAHWINWLNDVDNGRIDDPKAAMQGNAWCFNVLIHSRRIAGRWLKQKAQTCQDPAAQSLRRAADHYTSLAESSLAGFNSPWDLALPPERFDQWTPALRQTQIARLKTARRQDQAAITEIEKALQLLK